MGHASALLLGLAFIAYALYQFFWKKGQLQWLYALLLLLVTPFVAYNQYQHFQNRSLQSSEHMAEWHVATTAADFQKILAAAPADRRLLSLMSMQTGVWLVSLLNIVF